MVKTLLQLKEKNKDGKEFGTNDRLTEVT